ncbi:hypothetical protein GCM10022234_00050 [Aeromicrobium panaciterrae]|uniref:peptidoglycan DD-metalloendopeptidase family protein n=1 Tax=Aeromicrobium panaciterrae TaxID=363861 RepID=UPI0031E09ABE
MAAPTTKPIGTPYGKKGDWAAGYHPGVDFLCPVGTPLKAPADSTIIYAGTRSPWGTAYGTCVIGETKVNGARYRWITAHMSSTSVKAGQRVKLGAALGKSGNTGRTTGPHCHFEVRHSPFGYWDHLNPKVVLDVKAAPSVPVTPEDQIYIVTAKTELLGREWPVDGPVRSSAANGHIVTSVGRTAKQKDGEVWVKNVSGFYWSTKYLEKKATPPPTPKMTIRPLWYNIPGPDKIKNDSTRAKAGAALIKSGRPSVFGLNELVGTGKNTANPTVPSPFAKKVSTALGLEYGMVIPTTAANENYLFWEKDSTGLVKRYPDLKVYAKVDGKAVPGRHLTVAVFEDIKSGQEFVFGVTHLVDGKQWGAGRTAQAVLIRKELDRISALHGNAPIFIGGDMNRSDDLPAFTERGQCNLRKNPKASTNAMYATYTNIANDVMGKNPEWIIDHGYGPANFVRNGYTVLLGYDASGTFPPIRPSDHVPILFSVTAP